ncbi:hypothetical protein CCMA1212_010066 [Trichoderma ghanense]|uniref:Uncharacterized protein n=1 Tax=Trichoderma ghanense TaxID=65468 RepID=A0ABY2GQW8_9HYPO
MQHGGNTKLLRIPQMQTRYGRARCIVASLRTGSRPTRAKRRAAPTITLPKVNRHHQTPGKLAFFAWICKELQAEVLQFPYDQVRASHGSLPGLPFHWARRNCFSRRHLSPIQVNRNEQAERGRPGDAVLELQSAI